MRARFVFRVRGSRNLKFADGCPSVPCRRCLAWTGADKDEEKWVSFFKDLMHVLG